MVGIRNTKQKELLLNYFKNNSNKHISVSKIKENMDGRVGLTTIYRIINSLVKTGEIIKIPLDDKQGFCYQYNCRKEECQMHYHLICENCGKLEHFECGDVDKIIEGAKNNKDFSINPQKVVFYGKCKKCRGDKI